MNIELYNALLDAGAADQKARAAATSIPPAGGLATKTDLAQLETRLRRLIRIGCSMVVGVIGVSALLIIFLPLLYHIYMNLRHFF